MQTPKCIGRWCPKSLNAINVVGFGIRAGVIPYISPTSTENGKVLLGVKKYKYTDFGGGCKVGKHEKPFDCAQREFTEESLGVIQVNPLNMTHILVTGNNAPHQIVLLIAVTQKDVENVEQEFEDAKSKVRVSELNKIELLSYQKLKRLNKNDLSESLFKIKGEIERIIR